VPKFYIKWQGRPQQLEAWKPEDIETSLKEWLSRSERGKAACGMVKADLKVGNLKDWGCDLSGESGYAISEGLSETELSAVLQKYAQYIHFEVTPVLTADQFVESATKAADAMKKVVAAAKK
jgi:hypothetical protein